MMKKILIASAVGAALVLAGCASQVDNDKKSEVSANEFNKFIENHPTFEAQSIGNPGIDLTLSAVAGTAKAQYDAVVALNEAVGAHLDGYKVNECLKKGTDFETCVKPENAEGKTEEGKTEADIRKDYDAYKAEMLKVTEAQTAQKEQILKVVAGVAEIAAQVATDKEKVFAGMSMLQMASGSSKIKTAGEQAAYAKDCLGYFTGLEAQLKNINNSEGQK